MLDSCEDVPKYRKHSKKRRADRADHKHEWVDAIGVETLEGNSIFPEPVKVCSICRKTTRGKDPFFSLKGEGNFRILQLNLEEVIRENPTLEVIYLNEFK